MIFASFILWILALFYFLRAALARLEMGLFESDITFNNSRFIHFQRSAYNGSIIQIKVLCGSNKTSNNSLRIDIVIRSSPCGKEFYERLGVSADNQGSADEEEILKVYFDGSYDQPNFFNEYGYKSYIYRRQTFTHPCDGIAHQLIDEDVTKKITSRRQTLNQTVPKDLKIDHPLFALDSDEIYLLILRFVASKPNLVFNVHTSVEWKNENSYLGPIDWPLLPFFGLMCGIYGFFAILWLTWCFWRWRDLLRIQYAIGAVIAFGLIEKMIFYIEYQKMNTTGSEAEGAVEFAEILSCSKKTLSVILVIIVSVGYGVVKPRLGSTLQKVVGLGFVYFLLCSIEGVVRVSKVQHESVKQKQIVVLPLLLMQLGLFYWIFMSLVNTTRALRLRRNEVKLSLYRHFTHTLIFCVLSSVCYMIWSLISHNLNRCLKDWKELWVDTAFWHVLFSVLLFVIMVLWRPTINNQRYAFTPLLDNAEDDDEEDTVFSEAFTSSEAIKLRTSVSNHAAKADIRKLKEKENIEDDLKWIEQHIPSSLADRALPALVDSDEEREQTKFEVSKML